MQSNAQVLTFKLTTPSLAISVSLPLTSMFPCMSRQPASFPLSLLVSLHSTMYLSTLDRKSESNSLPLSFEIAIFLSSPNIEEQSC